MDRLSEEDTLTSRMIEVLEGLLETCGFHHMPQDITHVTLTEQIQAIDELCKQGMRILGLAEPSEQGLRFIPDLCSRGWFVHVLFPQSWRMIDDESVMSKTITDIGSVLIVRQTDGGEVNVASLVSDRIGGAENYRIVLP